MNILNYLTNYKLIVVIVKKGHALKLVKKLKKVGVEGNTIMYGKGIANPKAYEQVFGITYEPSKEIIIMALDEKKVDKVLEKTTKLEHLDQPGNGIAIVLDLNKCSGIARLLAKKEDEKWMIESMI